MPNGQSTVLFRGRSLVIGASPRANKSLLKAAIEANHTIIPLNDCALGPRGQTLLYKNQPVRLDTLFQKQTKAYEHPFQHMLDLQGTFQLNNPTAINTAINKFLTFMTLKKHGIPTPESALVSRKKHVFDAVDYIREFCKGNNPQLVLKPLYGTKGQGIVKLMPEVAMAYLMKTVSPQTPYLVQPFIASAKNSDYRFIMMQDEDPGASFVAGMRRTAKPGDFRANLAQGGTAEPIPNMPLHEAMAYKTLKALGLGYGGIDIMDSDNGPQVIEANSNPGNAISRVVGFNVSKRLIDRLAEKIT